MRVIVADDSILLREGIASLLADEGFEVCGRAGTADELIRLVRETRPELAIVDIRMPPGQRDEGIMAMRRIREEIDSGIAVLVLSQYLEPEFALRLLEEGGRGLGYLLKDRVADVGQFVEAVRQVARGGLLIDPAIVARLLDRRRHRDPLGDLSQREREVLGLMAEGRSNQAIAERLFLSEKTVEGYVGTIFGKLGLEPTAEDHRRVLAVLAYLQDR